MRTVVRPSFYFSHPEPLQRSYRCHSRGAVKFWWMHYTVWKQSKDCVYISNAWICCKEVLLGATGYLTTCFWSKLSTHRLLLVWTLLAWKNFELVRWLKESYLLYPSKSCNVVAPVCYLDVKPVEKLLWWMKVLSIWNNSVSVKLKEEQKEFYWVIII